jgi:hypothetical protein
MMQVRRATSVAAGFVSAEIEVTPMRREQLTEKIPISNASRLELATHHR